MIGKAVLRGTQLRAAALLSIAFAIAFVLVGCGSKLHNPIEIKLERMDLVSVSKQLLHNDRAVEDELTSAHATWPYLYNGLPSRITRSVEARISDSTRKMAALPELPFLRRVHDLTGPASDIGGAYEKFWSLGKAGWEMIQATVLSLRHGPASTARFREENLPVYIQSVYDAHYSLSLIGKDVKSGYEKLGGSEGFGAALTPIEVETIMRLYSPEVARLEPHTTEALGR